MGVSVEEEEEETADKEEVVGTQEGEEHTVANLGEEVAGRIMAGRPRLIVHIQTTKRWVNASLLDFKKSQL
jgi:hypothetical protein